MLFFLILFFPIAHACHTVRTVELDDGPTTNIQTTLNHVVSRFQKFLRAPSMDGLKSLFDISVVEREISLPSNSSEPCNDVVMIELKTTYDWNESKLSKYNRILQRELRKLEKYSGTSVNSLGKDLKIIPAQIHKNTSSYYGQRIFMSHITTECPSIKEFIRKAVSWSTNISSAIIACRCNPTIAIYKV